MVSGTSLTSSQRLLSFDTAVHKLTVTCTTAIPLETTDGASAILQIQERGCMFSVSDGGFIRMDHGGSDLRLVEIHICDT